jgi:predicted murein hydrolase (TIGR00659 family)
MIPEVLRQAWSAWVGMPLFGLTLTLMVYVLVQAVYARSGGSTWVNPVFWSVLVLAVVLGATGVPYERYFASAQFIHLMLGPAVVAMAWPLWQRRTALRERGAKLFIAALLGGGCAAGSAVAMAAWLGLPREVVLSLAPKSLTTPVAMGVAEKIGGIPALAAVFVVLTGMMGAIGGTYLFALLRIPRTPRGMMVRGFAMGTAAHGIGAARAMQVNAEAGAYAGLAMGMQSLLAALLIPLLVGWLG